MTITDLMGILYPLLTFAAFARGCIGIMYYITIMRAPIVLAAAATYFAEAAVLMILARSASGAINIDDFRIYVVILRFILLLALLWSCYESYKAIFKLGTREAWY